MNEPATSAGDHPPPAIHRPPSTEYRVQLDAYAGPLDLLLYLVKRHEIDLHDIPMAMLTQQYLDHLQVIESLAGTSGGGSGGGSGGASGGTSGGASGGGAMDVERAGEFLVMAATLVEIKSAMLMPRLEAAEGSDVEDADDPAAGATDALDPRFELVQQLLAYKRFKDASLALEERYTQWEHRFPALAKAPAPESRKAGPDDDGSEAAPVELDLEDVNVMDLCSAFGRMLDAIGFTGDHAVTYDDTPISLHADDIADRLERDAGSAGMTLQQVFVGRSSRSEMIGLFLATLELVRQRRVIVVQDTAGGDIRLQLRPQADRDDLDDAAGDDPPPPAPDNPQAGEIEYEWPDEQTRRRAERRARLRAVYAAKSSEQGQSPPDSADEEEDGPAPSPSAPPEADFDHDDELLDDNESSAR